MSKRSLVTLGIIAAICVVGLPAWAILTEGAQSAAVAPIPSSQRAAQLLFQTNCGQCHTLAAGGTDGQVGPNLDKLLATGPSSPSTIKANYTRVLTDIEHGLNGRMPANILVGEDAKTVAHFVAENVQYVGTTTTPSTTSSTPSTSTSSSTSTSTTP